MRVRLDISYDGTEFRGWAAQPNRRTVQGVLEPALATVLRLPSARLTVAGRTDSGVHATGQVGHLDLPVTAWEHGSERLVRQLAGVLPADVRVRAISRVPAAFDARFSALSRRYRYRISTAPAGADPLRRHEVLSWRRPLDAEAMGRSAQSLLGLHDFAAFCRSRIGGTTVRSLEAFSVESRGEEIVCDIRADAFCHSMVRSLVGALLAVGEGRQSVDWPAQQLTRTARAGEVSVAPAHGLTLVDVQYPPEADLAERAARTRALRPALNRARPRPGDSNAGSSARLTRSDGPTTT